MSNTADRLYRELLPVLEDAVGVNRFVSRTAFRELGYPVNESEDLARASRQLASREDAEDLSRKTADRLARRLDNPETDPAKLAANIPRY